MNINGETAGSRLSSLMTSVVLCHTGVAAKERAYLCRLALRMGAEVDNNLTRATTHLICLIAKGAKYEASMRPPLLGRVQVVKPEYVRLCYASITRLDEGKFLTPALAGFKISISGFDTITRDKLRDVIISMGGTYSPSLNADTTDVLILRHAVGAKYKSALAWGIPCVSQQWLHDSHAQGCRRDAGDYRLVGQDAGQKKRKRDTRRCLFEDEVAEVHRASINAHDSGVFDSVVAFVVASSADAAIYDISQMDVLLSRGQGTRIPVLTAAVTHIIVAPGATLTSQEKEQSAQHTNSPYFVRATWVAASVNAHERQPEPAFTAF